MRNPLWLSRSCHRFQGPNVFARYKSHHMYTPNWSFTSPAVINPRQLKTFNSSCISRLPFLCLFLLLWRTMYTSFITCCHHFWLFTDSIIYATQNLWVGYILRSSSFTFASVTSNMLFSYTSIFHNFYLRIEEHMWDSQNKRLVKSYGIYNITACLVMFCTAHWRTPQ